LLDIFHPLSANEVAPVWPIELERQQLLLHGPMIYYRPPVKNPVRRVKTTPGRYLGERRACPVVPLPRRRRA
jgi:hypothetical protein